MNEIRNEPANEREGASDESKRATIWAVRAGTIDSHRCPGGEHGLGADAGCDHLPGSSLECAERTAGHRVLGHDLSHLRLGQRDDSALDGGAHVATLRSG